MAQQSLSKEQALEAVLAVNVALRAGHPGPGTSGSHEKGAITIAAEALGLNRCTFQARLRAAKLYGCEPDFAGGGVAKPKMKVAAIQQKPEVRISAHPKPREVIAAKAYDRVQGLTAPRRKVMVIGDAHDSPNLSKDRFRWMGRFANDERPEDIVQIGDFLTLDSLNGHIGNSTFNGRLKGTFLEDMASGNEAMSEFSSAFKAGYAPRRHVTLGNHERRAWLFEDFAPEVAGMMQVEITGLFEQNGWSWSPYGEFHFIDGVGFVHAALNRMGKTYGGKNAEMTICNDAIFDMVIGHSHTPRTWKAPKIGPGNFVTVVNAGCALPDGHIEEYARHNTTGWGWGLNILEIEGGHIVDSQFVSMATLEARYG